MEIQKHNELKQQLITAQENTVVLFKESEPELNLLVVEGSKYLNKGITSDTEMTEAASVAARISKKEKEIDEQRKSVTRILDSVKKDWMDRQEKLLAPAIHTKKEISIINNRYLSEKQKKIQADKERIQKEADQKAERNTLPAKIKNCYEKALTTELSLIKQQMEMSWARLTMDIFEERIGMLKKYTAKVNSDKFYSYFDIVAKYITQDEVDGSVRTNADYDKFCTEYYKSFLEIKQHYIDNIDRKRNQLKTQSENERLQLEAKAQADLIEKRAQEIADQKKKEEELRDFENNQILSAEMEAQGRLAVLDEVKGRTKWQAYIVGAVDWNKAVNLYAEENGIEKFQFLLDWLASGKGGRPEIDGITYESSKTVINKI